MFDMFFVLLTMWLVFVCCWCLCLFVVSLGCLAACLILVRCFDFVGGLVVVFDCGGRGVGRLRSRVLFGGLVRLLVCGLLGLGCRLLLVLSCWYS